jgi:hypothetical protein
MTLRELINQVTNNDSESLVLDYDIELASHDKFFMHAITEELIDFKENSANGSGVIYINLRDDMLAWLKDGEL